MHEHTYSHTDNKVDADRRINIEDALECHTTWQTEQVQNLVVSSGSYSTRLVHGKQYFHNMVGMTKKLSIT